MDPPAGFVRARNPAVAAPRRPCPPRARISGPPTTQIASAAAVPAQRRAAPARSVADAPATPRNASRLQRVLEDAGQREFRGVPAHVNVALRKIANLLKPDKEIVQEGDHMIIRTLSTFRNYIMDFEVGKEFEEDLTGIDDRKCMTTVSWDGDRLECVQKGEKEGRGWTQWIEGDELHLEMRVQGVVCKQVFKKVH
ncbi:RBP1 [Marmota monax]|nr:RBP1 [Marmota monax]KAI6067334.1 RBP1 [Marmota monax]